MDANAEQGIRGLPHPRKFAVWGQTKIGSPDDQAEGGRHRRDRPNDLDRDRVLGIHRDRCARDHPVQTFRGRAYTTLAFGNVKTEWG